MRNISISLVLLFVCSALLFDVGLGRSNVDDDHIPHPKAVSRFTFYFGWPFTPAPPPPPPAAPSGGGFYFGWPFFPAPTPPAPAAPKKQPPAAPKKQPPSSGSPPKVPAVPAWNPPTISRDTIQKCWSSLGTIDRCVLEIVTAFFSLDFSHVGPDCCAAVVGVDDNCYGQMFQQFNTRFYAPALRQNCAQRSHSQPRALPKA